MDWNTYFTTEYLQINEKYHNNLNQDCFCNLFSLCLITQPVAGSISSRGKKKKKKKETPYKGKIIIKILSNRYKPSIDNSTCIEKNLMNDIYNSL